MHAKTGLISWLDTTTQIPKEDPGTSSLESNQPAHHGLGVMFMSIAGSSHIT